MENNNEKRRKVLALGLIAGAGALSGVSLKNLISGDEDKVKMLTASGEMVIVDRKHLPKNVSPKKVSNSDLKKWMESEKDKKI